MLHGRLDCPLRLGSFRESIVVLQLMTKTVSSTANYQQLMAILDAILNYPWVIK